MASEPTTPRRPVIPPGLDPTFEGEPNLADVEAIVAVEPADETAEVLQFPGPRRESDLLRDPEDETLDLPAEEQAIHVTERPD